MVISDFRQWYDNPLRLFPNISVFLSLIRVPSVLSPAVNNRGDFKHLKLPLHSNFELKNDGLCEKPWCEKISVTLFWAPLTATMVSQYDCWIEPEQVRFSGKEGRPFLKMKSITSDRKWSCENITSKTGSRCNLPDRSSWRLFKTSKIYRYRWTLFFLSKKAPFCRQKLYRVVWVP